jgi:hypothetical protein
MSNVVHCRGCGIPVLNFGGSRSREWCSEQCRCLNSYGGVCVDCGGATTGRGAGRAFARCTTCAGIFRRWWTQERLLEEGRRLVRILDRRPTASDLNPAVIRDSQRRERTYELLAESGPWPDVGTIQQRFGSWNAFVVALGYEPRRPGAAGGRPNYLRDLHRAFEHLHRHPEDAIPAYLQPAAEERAA